MGTNRIQYIDVWRVIAVAFVILHHLASYSTLHKYFAGFPAIIDGLAGLGKLGVQIFFVISGFVICRGLITEETKNRRINLDAFYVRRFLRIVPPLLLYLAVISVFTLFGLTTSFRSELVKSAVFLCNIPIDGYPCGFFTGHTWSLAYEEQFYLLFPVLFVALSFAERPSVLLSILLLMLMASFTALAGASSFAPEYLLTFMYMLAGCAAALYWGGLRSVLNKLSPIAWAMAAIMMIVLTSHVTQTLVINLILFGTVQPVLICIVVLGTPSNTRLLKRVFESQKLSYLGKMSYGVYLWQQLATASYPSLPAWSTLVFLIGVFALSYFLYEHFEKRLIAVGSSYTGRVETKRKGPPLLP